MQKKILIINPFGIGDVLFTTPVIRAVKKKFPASFLGYLCNRQVEPILKNNPNIDELFFYSRGDLKKIKKNSYFQYLKTLQEAFLRLKKINFDLAIDLSLVSQYSFMLWLIGVRQRVGFDYKKRGFFLNRKICLAGFRNKHVIEYYRDLLNYLEINAFEPKTEYFLDKSDEDWADNFLKKNKIVNGQALVGISAFGGASWGETAKNKQWPSERFAKVGKKIVERYNARIILFGLEKEKNEIDRLKQIIGENFVIDACGKTDLGQLASLLKRLNFFIANDSGPLHIASSLDVKTISVFGPVDEKVYGPLGSSQRHIVVSKELSCRPCYQDFKTPNCQNMQCLLQITEDDIFKKVEGLL